MAKYARVITWQARQVWAASDLKPHRLKSFKISKNPHFADKMGDVVGLYLNPSDNALVLSVDEKIQIQALDRTQPILPLRPAVYSLNLSRPAAEEEDRTEIAQLLDFSSR